MLQRVFLRGLTPAYRSVPSNFCVRSTGRFHPRVSGCILSASWTRREDESFKRYFSATGGKDCSSADPKKDHDEPSQTLSAVSNTSETGESAIPTKISLLPREVVAELERFIVGQDEAKKAVAIALRTRWRRRLLDPLMQEEVMPKNILMIGPTGVGKTEIARRLAKLCEAPFIKVEATKFTEVGFHGRDVDQIIRDLVDIGIQQQKEKMRVENEIAVSARVEEIIVDLLAGDQAQEATKESFRKLLKEGELEDREVSIFVESVDMNADDEASQIVSKLFAMAQRGRGKKRKLPVREARPLLKSQEADKMLDTESLTRAAIESIEQDGIVFIDEVDKICTAHDATRQGADASSEGVQRDLLPLIEGSIVSTKKGNVDTSKILFIASGAFYGCKPSDLLPELQGRLPIRVELKALNADDLYRILTEPEANLIKQQVALMKAENIDLSFTDDAVKEIAKIAAEVNETVENIGARRLHTIIEKIMEEVSFNCDNYAGQRVELTKEKINDTLKPMLIKTDLSRFVL